MNLFEILNCGCGGTRRETEEETERIIREVEKEREDTPVVIPVRKTDTEPERIPVREGDVFVPTRKREPVPVRE